MRQGAAWPSEGPRSWLLVRSRNRFGTSQRASLGVVTKEVRMPAVLSSPCPRSRPAFGVRCPTSACPSDRCPVRTSECPVSGVRPLASRVRAFRCPLCPTAMRSWGVAVGQAAARLGWPGRRGRPPCPRRRVVCPRLEPGSKAGAGRAGPAEGRLGVGGRRGRWLAVGQVDRVAGRQLAATTLRGHCQDLGPESPGL
jgi:hypothetical protein